MNKPLTIGIDFDGTLHKHSYPEVGEVIPGAYEVLQRLQARGHKLILWTMRSNESLVDAVKAVESHGIKLHGANKNPGQDSWTNSPKQFAHIYIDDAALGCPLIQEFKNGAAERPFVDWVRVENLLTEQGVL